MKKILTTKTKQKELERIKRFLVNNDSWIFNLHHSNFGGDDLWEKREKEIRLLQHTWKELKEKIVKLYHENKDLLDVEESNGGEE